MKTTYYLVIHENNRPKGVSTALKSILSKESAAVVLQDGNPVITRKEDGLTYRVTSKKYFEYDGADGVKILFIICDADKVKK